MKLNDEKLHEIIKRAEAYWVESCVGPDVEAMARELLELRAQSPLNSVIHKQWKAYVDEWTATLNEYKERLAAAEEALRWYANPTVYELDDANGYYPAANIPIFEDEGRRARGVLEDYDKVVKG